MHGSTLIVYTHSGGYIHSFTHSFNGVAEFTATFPHLELASWDGSLDYGNGKMKDKISTFIYCS